MAATKLNLFATSGSDGFLRCLTADPGSVIVGSDINSLEPHVLAHFSQDEGFMKIYGKGQPHNCIYLYLASKSPIHGSKIREIYNPYDPQYAAVEEAKKLRTEPNEAGESLVIRQLYKTTVLACNYGGGPSRLRSKMQENDITMSEEQCYELVQLHRKTFTGLRKFQRKLEKEWNTNGGYIITGRGRPQVVPKDKVKDFLAFFCQSTGHDYLMRLLWHINCYRKDHNLGKFVTPFIPDFHDATYFQVKKDYVEQAKEMIKYGYDRLNDELDLTVELKGGIKVGQDLRIK
jgi:hypothetical protein